MKPGYVGSSVTSPFLKVVLGKGKHPAAPLSEFQATSGSLPAESALTMQGVWVRMALLIFLGELVAHA